jgi:hypothetical protein
VALSARCGPVVVLRHRADGVVAGAHEDAATAVVGGDHQHRLHVVFHPAVCGRRSALAPQPRRLGGVCPAVRRAVVRRAHRLCRPACGTAVGGRPLHPRRRRRWSVQPALHVQRPRRCPRRRAAGRHAHQPARCPPLRRADLDSRLGNAASAVGRSTAQFRTGQRESGRGDSLAACRIDRVDLGVPVAPCQAVVASAAGGLPVGDGLRAGVLRRALRRRHPAGLGGSRDRAADDGPR